MWRQLISHRFPLEQAEQAYDLLASDEPSLGILLEYGRSEPQPQGSLSARTVTLADSTTAPGKASLAFIGAGNYAGRALIPAFKAAGAAAANAGQCGWRQRRALRAQVRLCPGFHRLGSGDCRSSGGYSRHRDSTQCPCQPGAGRAACRQACILRKAAVPDAGRTGGDRGRGAGAAWSAADGRVSIVASRRRWSSYANCWLRWQNRRTS